jgi:acetyltransferase-like isoleucine patch superfamily enzyme
MKIKQGIGCFIHSSVQISDDAELELGDHVYIGENVKILPGKLKIGDYSKIHSGTYINPLNGIDLGHLTWVGQNCIIDGVGGISAGNYLGVGMASSLYSHIRQGDITEGCRFDRNKQLIIGDDVWFVGMCLVSPITAYNKSMAMLGSVITSDMQSNTIYGGNPAKEISSKLGKQFEPKTIEEKTRLLHAHICEYEKTFNTSMLHVRIVTEYPNILDPTITYYNVSDRTYSKTNSESEITFNKWLFRYKAKFIPKQ